MSRKFPSILTVIASVIAAAIVAAGCASATRPETAAADGPEECRDVVLPGQETASNVCGMPAQWAEYEQRTAIYQPGVSCRDMLGYRSNTVSTVCATEEDWAEYDRGEATSALRAVWRLQGSNYGQ